jgi:hypothetical protein
MIPKPCRDLLDTTLEMARTMPYDDLAKANLDRAQGMLNYALARGDLLPAHHATELVTIDLIRAQRKNRKGEV